MGMPSRDRPSPRRHALVCGAVSADVGRPPALRFSDRRAPIRTTRSAQTRGWPSRGRAGRAPRRRRRHSLRTCTERGAGVRAPDVPAGDALMAAITGILSRTATVDREALATALASAGDAMRRRAPIEGGMAIAYDASIGLAHRASEGPGGEAVLQPLRNENGTLWLVADGEPSNAADLRLELIGAGHRFQSSSGSEVILHLYEHEGVARSEEHTSELQSLAYRVCRLL